MWWRADPPARLAIRRCRPHMGYRRQAPGAVGGGGGPGIGIGHVDC
ncbi:MAG: hypothetical protein OXU61_07920 [Gammaproteobacteria bacterium]|nr:hypothetical protein [Gammaproteobacteria bacterium]